jgi:4-amino-4-deoxy-L-arabinose transferase-like glycosyltransferase
LITTGAAALRLTQLGAVPNDPFYDAAVRSMSLSLHNFFFGAYEPGGTIAVDKPPIDLWLQVISTKLFGYSSLSLKLPPALAGTLAVPLLFDALRRLFGSLTGLAAALALAVLPIAVLSSRSDTMDAVAMALNVAALWFLVRYAQTNRARFCYFAAAALGVAFNVKVFQGLVCLPALFLFAALICRSHRARTLALTALVFLAVALSWLTATLLFPASQRPYAIGSTNGSAWNAAFVYNGYDRIAGSATQSALNAAGLGVLKAANNTEPARAAVAIASPGLLRLFAHNDPLSGLRLGFILLSALLLGVPALLDTIIRARGPDERPRRAFAAALLTWLLGGFALFSAMARLHPRYAEAFTAAAAAAAGFGLVWVLKGGRLRSSLAALAILALTLYALFLLSAANPIWLLTAAAAVLALLALALPRGRLRKPALATGLAGVAFLLPLQVSLGLIAHHEYDSGHTGVIAPAQVADISRYIAARRGGARYQFVVADPSEVGAVIVADVQPILSLTSSGAHELLPVSRLAQLVATGQVRFAYIGGPCVPSYTLELSPCSPGAAWVRAHGIDVSRAAGLPSGAVLYFLPRRYRHFHARAGLAHALDPHRR